MSHGRRILSGRVHGDAVEVGLRHLVRVREGEVAPRLHDKPSELGGYALFALRRSYSGSARGGIANSWALVERGMSYERSVELMNHRLDREDFTLPKRGG